MIDKDKYAKVIDDDGYFCEDRIADLLAEAERLRLVIKNVAEFPKKCPPNLKLKGVIDAMRCMLLGVIE